MSVTQQLLWCYQAAGRSGGKGCGQPAPWRHLGSVKFVLNKSCYMWIQSSKTVQATPIEHIVNT
jgi:hypothetical protein